MNRTSPHKEEPSRLAVEMWGEKKVGDWRSERTAWGSKGVERRGKKEAPKKTTR